MDERELATRMKADWDRRIAHDYRFWMSDGYQSDDVMWETGERDFAIITEGIENSDQKSILEIGCGVGRLIKPAIRKFATVTGVDISEEALKRASNLIGDESNLNLVLGDGFTLKQIDDNAIDVVFSFASITSTPLEIFSRYLLEANRVLKPGAVLRLQVYLGSEQQVTSEDTLHLRCFKEENFQKAIIAAGFSIEWIEELKLPFQVSFEEAGIIAKIGSFQKSSLPRVTHTEIANLLMPNGEPEEADAITGLEVECWMSLNYARELAESGDLDRAKETLEFAVTHAKTINLDIQDILTQIVTVIEKKESELNPAAKKADQTKTALKVEEVPVAGTVISETLLAPTPKEEGNYVHNMEVLREKFPKVFSLLCEESDDSSIETKATKEGAALFYDGQALDHPTAPRRGAENWVRSQLQTQDYSEAKDLFVYGFGGGYHLEEVRKQRPEVTLSVIEPSVDVLKEALKQRDMRELLSNLDQLIIGDAVEKITFRDEAQVLFRPQTTALFPENTGKVKTQFHGARGLGLLSPTITVLGPLHGGTLPILNYTVHGLSHMNQRVRAIDMSPFSSGFKSMDGLVHDELRQNIIRGKFTENLSEMVLEIANEKPMDILICMAQAPITGKTLDALRERGVITVLWFVEDYLRFQSWKYMAKHYDFIFTIQRGECLDAIKAAGAGEVHYLPTAADPFVHAPLDLSEEEKKRWGSPVSFVGAGYHNRQQMFASLSNMDFKIWGTEWPECKPFDRMVQEKGRRLKPEEYVKIFNATDVNLNLHSSTERDGVDPAGDFLNPRTFELAACGAFQLVDKRSLLSEVFVPGEEVEVFENRTELVEKINYYLAHPEAKQPFIEKARARVLKDHTYEHRLQDMLSIIYSSRFEVLKRKQSASPWTKVIQRAEPYPELKQRCEVAFARGEEPNLDGLVADIVTGEGKLSETEQKLLFLHHIRKQMIRMRHEESGK